MTDPDKMLKEGTTLEGYAPGAVQHASLQEKKKDATLSAQREQRSDSSQSRQQATPHHTHHHLQPQTNMQSTLTHYCDINTWTSLYQQLFRLLWRRKPNNRTSRAWCSRTNNARKKCRHVLFLQGLQLPVRGNPLPYLNQQVRAAMCKISE